MDNNEILRKLDQAYKAVTVGDLGNAVLAPQKFDQFIKSMQNRTKVLPEARFIPMDSQITDIDRVGFVGRVLTAGVAANEAVVSVNGAGEASVSPTFGTNRLIAKELRALTGIRDRALRRNIERGNFENTLVDMFGEAAGRDFEEWAILANTGAAARQGGAFPAADNLLTLTDGWAEKAANKVYGIESAGGAADNDFDPNDVETIFDAMITALPKQYLLDRSEWRIYVPWEVEDAYRNALRARGTQLGDSAQISGQDLLYKGFPISYCPMMERSNAPVNGAGRICWLTHPDNTVWGVFEEVNIEREREAKQRQTDFILTFEGDAHYEDENAAVVAYLDLLAR